MSDVEKDIRELLDEEVRSAPPPHEATATVHRTRRRQGAVIAGGALAAVALVAASLVGLRALDRADRATFLDRPTVTTSLNGITISHPESWHVVDPDEAGLNGPEPTPDLPKLVMALSPMGRGELLGCPGMIEGSAAPTFLLTIQEQPLALTGDAARPWPVELESLDLATNDGTAGESACYPGWSFRQATWTAEGRTFEAAVGLAPDLSDADRDALLDAFASMTFEPIENGSAAAVLDEGKIDGEAWQLIASRDNAGLALSLETNDGAAGIGGFVTGTRDLQFGEMVIGSGDGAGLVVFGAVPPGTAEIECPAPAGSRTLDVPDAIDDRFEAFLVFVDVGLEIEIHAVDAEGNVIASGRAGSAGTDPTETPMPGELAVPGEVGPEQGGVYWGAYVWLGPAGAAAAESVAEEVRALGATPSVGELACDQGAAESLGTNAEWRVAVYFRTRQEAEDWLLGSGFVGHEAGTGVARVTTFCLD
jgi:hypothetical protein